MADKNKDQELDIVETLDKTEKYIDENKKSLSIIIGAIVLVVGGYFAYTSLIVKPKEKAAQEQMFVAEKYFRTDSLDLALNGDGNYPGFLTIIDDYSSTNAANLSHYYAGMIYLKKGEFQSAIDHLKNYDAEDAITGALAFGAIGDANMELGNADEAVSYYNKAVSYDENKLTAPLFMMKAAQVLESKSDYKKALELYNKIKDKYSDTTEGRDIEKYIARAEMMVK